VSEYSLKIYFIASNTAYVVLLPASISNSLNLYWHSLAFIYKQDKDIPWLPRLEIRSADIRHFGNPKCRNRHFGTSVVRLVDIRYIDLSQDRNADLNNLDTRKSTTHTPHRKSRFPIRGPQKQHRKRKPTPK